MWNLGPGDTDVTDVAQTAGHTRGCRHLGHGLEREERERRRRKQEPQETAALTTRLGEEESVPETWALAT